jgi:hypothetical protein
MAGFGDGQRESLPNRRPERGFRTGGGDDAEPDPCGFRRPTGEGHLDFDLPLHVVLASVVTVWVVDLKAGQWPPIPARTRLLGNRWP